MNGHLECLQLLHIHGAPWDEATARYAAMAPDSACWQYLHENGCPWDERTAELAAKVGKIDTLRYAMEQGCPYNGPLVEFSAHSNNLACLQYLVEQGLYMDKEVFKVALLKGNLACLQYLIDQGCPYLGAKYNEEFLDTVIRMENSVLVECVQYAIERGWKPNLCFIAYIAAKENSFSMSKLDFQSLFGEINIPCAAAR